MAKLLHNISLNLKHLNSSFNYQALQSTHRLLTTERSANQVFLIGRVGSDLVLRGTPQRPVLLFTLATSHIDLIEEDDQEEGHKTDRHRISVFKATLRRHCVERVKKGSRLLIQGKISYHPVTDRSGSHQTTSIVADEIVVLQAAPKSEIPAT